MPSRSVCCLAWSSFELVDHGPVLVAAGHQLVQSLALDDGLLTDRRGIHHQSADLLQAGQQCQRRGRVAHRADVVGNMRPDAERRDTLVGERVLEHGTHACRHVDGVLEVRHTVDDIGGGRAAGETRVAGVRRRERVRAERDHLSNTEVDCQRRDDVGELRHCESGSGPLRVSTSWPSASRPTCSSMSDHSSRTFTPARSSIVGLRAR